MSDAYNPPVDKNDARAQQAKQADAAYKKSQNACYTTNVQYTRKQGAIGKPMGKGK